MRSLRLLPMMGLVLASPLQASDPMPVWSRSFGLHSDSHAASVAMDGSGNIAVTGDFEGTLDLGGGPLYSEGVRDIFVAKFDAGGGHVWSRSFGDFDYDAGVAVAMDEPGNAIVTGRFRRTVDFGGGPFTSELNDDIFLAKYDPAGNHLWSRHFGDERSQSPTSLAVDGAGNITITGTFYGTVDFGGGPFTSDNQSDVFVAPFDAGGNHLWSRKFATDAFLNPYSVAASPSGNVALVGSFSDTVDFGGGPIASAGGTDIFVASFDDEGHHLWSRGFGSTGFDRALSAAIDDAGNVVVTGFFVGTVDFGGGPLASAGGDEVFIAKLDPGGTHLWSRRFGDGDDQVAASVAVRPSGDLVVTGYFDGTVDFGGGPLTSIRSLDLFIASFDASGDHLWSRSYEDISYGSYGAYGSGSSVAVDASGNVAFTGGFEGTVNLGGEPLASGFGMDSFVAKLDSGGNHLWSQVLGDLSGYGAAVSAVTNAPGNTVIAGYFEGTIDFGGGPIASAGGPNIFMASFDAGGAPLWIRRFGDQQAQYALGLAPDGAGNVVVAGIMTGSVDFGGGPLTSTTGRDLFVAKFDALGNHVWSRRFENSTQQYPTVKISVDGSGNVILAGALNGTLDFGGGPLTDAGGGDIFVAKLDAGGNHLWSRRFGDAAFQTAYSVATDGSGNISVTGAFMGTLDFGDGPLPNDGAAFVTKFDADGNPLWSRVFAGPGLVQYGASVAMNYGGNVVVAGDYMGTMDFGGGPLASAGGTDIFLASFDAAGNPLWSRRFGDVSQQFAPSVSLDAAGEILLGGNFYDNIDLGGGVLTDEGQGGIFVAKLDTGGNHLWSRSYGDDKDQYLSSVRSDGANGFLVAGYIDGAVNFGAEPVHGNYFGSPFVARFQDQVVPVLISSFEALVRRGTVEIRWDVASDESEERFTLYRRDVASPEGIAIAGGPLIRTARSYVDETVEPARTFDYELVIHTRTGQDIHSSIARVTTPALSAHLAQNVPNPFKSTTSIRYTLSGRTNAVLSIYDAAGRLVARLDQGLRDPGTHDAEWDGRDDSGRSVDSGVYFYRLESGGGGGVLRKMILIRSVRGGS